MVRVSVLGPLEVTDAAGLPVRVGGQRVRALLILLALDAGRVVSARSLIERLWPQERPTDAANALQSLVSRLRVALRRAGLPDGVLESTAVGYRLAASPAAVDALAFESQARAGAQALAGGDPATAARLLREALARWRGPALADVAGQEFAAAPAARLAELRSAALLDRIEAELALGVAGSGLIGELRELTAGRPARRAPGRAADARPRRRRPPGRGPRGLPANPRPAGGRPRRGPIPAARAGPPGGPAAAGPGRDARGRRTPNPRGARRPGPRRPERRTAPRRRRRQPTSFVGRDCEVAGLLKQLAAERLVTLTGPGGVGKTRLAAEAAGRLTGADYAGPDRSAWFVELAPVTEPSEVPHAVLDAVGLRERSIARRGGDGGADPADRLCAALAERDALLILDNCEHVIEAAAVLAARLLADCPGVQVLATSREPLRIGGESLHVVAPLPVPPAAEPGPPAGRGPPGPQAGPGPDSQSFPAVRLFADRAAAVLPDFAARRRQRRAGRPDLPGPRRHAAGDRAGGAVAAHADPGPAGRAPRRPVRAAHRRQPNLAAQAPDASRHRRLELAAALGARARARPPPRGLPRRRHADRGRAGLPGPGAAGTAAPARPADRRRGAAPGRAS